MNLSFRKYLSVSLVAIIGPACSDPIAGDWKTDAQGRGDPFYLTDASFKKDGTFDAIARTTGLILRMSGTYRQGWGKLIMKPQGRPELVYAVRVRLGGRELELTSAGQVLIMKRQENAAPVTRIRIVQPGAISGGAKSPAR